MFRIGAVSPKDLESVLERARGRQPTYEAHGATRRVDLPAGYRHDRHELRLGDACAFERSRDGLRLWQAHLGAGAQVFPGTPFAEGDSLLVVLRFGPVRVVAPCRVIYVIDEPDRFGLAYGTLPGHPESGEESFIVERNGDGSVTFRVTAFSRPAQFLSRCAAPITRSLQLRVTGRYLEALARFVAGADAPEPGSGA